MHEASGTPEVKTQAELREVAYNYEPYWGRGAGDWIKSLLLFFDGVALLVPDYMRDRPLVSDPVLAQPLADQGLLHRLSPEALVNQETAEALTDLLDKLINASAFDGLDRSAAFAELSHSRLGGGADAGLTEIVLEQLRERGLARPTEDGVSIPLHPAVRAFVLVVLPQLLRGPAEAAGYALQPASTQPQTLRALLCAAKPTPPAPTPTSSEPRNAYPDAKSLAPRPGVLSAINLSLNRSGWPPPLTFTQRPTPSDPRGGATVLHEPS